MRIRTGLVIGAIALLTSSGALAKDAKSAASDDSGSQATGSQTSVSEPADSDEESADVDRDHGPDDVNQRAKKGHSSDESSDDAED